MHLLSCTQPERVQLTHTGSGQSTTMPTAVEPPHAGCSLTYLTTKIPQLTHFPSSHTALGHWPSSFQSVLPLMVFNLPGFTLGYNPSPSQDTKALTLGVGDHAELPSVLRRCRPPLRPLSSH